MYKILTLSTFSLVAPWFEDEGEKEIMKETGEDAKLKCSAKGFPLSVEWKFKNKSDEVVNSCIGKVTWTDRLSLNLLTSSLVLRPREVPFLL